MQNEESREEESKVWDLHDNRDSQEGRAGFKFHKAD